MDTGVSSSRGEGSSDVVVTGVDTGKEESSVLGVENWEEVGVVNGTVVSLVRDELPSLCSVASVRVELTHEANKGTFMVDAKSSTFEETSSEDIDDGGVTGDKIDVDDDIGVGSDGGVDAGTEETSVDGYMGDDPGVEASRVDTLVCGVVRNESEGDSNVGTVVSTVWKDSKPE